MPRVGGIDWKSNNLVGVGAGVLAALAVLFGALKEIPYADKDQTNAEITELQGTLKAQWQAIDQLKKDSAGADLLQKGDIHALDMKYEALMGDERELKGEFEELQRRNLK